MCSLFRAIVRNPMLTILPALCQFSAVHKVSAIDLSLYLIADRTTVRNEEEFFARIDTCTRGGVTCVQWRDPDADYQTAVANVRRLQQILDERGVSLVINSHLDVARETNPSAVFLENRKVTYTDARAFLDERIAISIPVETVAEALATNDQNIDHISVKVFASTCASTDLVPVGLEKLRAIRKAFKGQIIAIGGINLSNIEEICKELRPGDGIAVRGDLWKGEDALAIAKKMRAIVDKVLRSDQE